MKLLRTMLEIGSPVRARKPSITAIQLAMVATTTTPTRPSNASGALLRKKAARSEPTHAHARETAAFARSDHLPRFANANALATATMLVSNGLVRMALAVITIAPKLNLPRSRATVAAFVRADPNMRYKTRIRESGWTWS